MRIFNLKFDLLSRCPGKRGFSFMEILVATVILLIGIAGIMGMLFWGRGVLKQKENKARAMNAASTIMEEFLAQPYERLGTVGRNAPVFHTVFVGNEGPLMEDAGTIDNIFNWTVAVRQEQMDWPEGPPAPPALHTWMRVPYRQIEVIVAYSEESPRRQGRIYNQQVRLVNIVPYPFMSTVKVELGPNNLNPVTTAYAPFGAGGLRADLDFETPRNLQIIYNIAIEIDTSNPAIQVPEDANLLTAVFLDGVQIATSTGTNVITQPLVNNNTSYTAVPMQPRAGGHVLEVRWMQDRPGGRVYLRGANLIVWATEPG
jgi:prepilin-type N-terminal cleavage/methylation domain-containing protein